MMTATATRTECFVFSGKFDAAIYRWLVTNHREDMERIKARVIKLMELDDYPLDLPRGMDWLLRELFAEQSPISVSPVDGACFDDSDIFEELLSDAISKCDFESIAAAFLAGVELPAYGPKKTRRELSQVL